MGGLALGMLLGYSLAVPPGPMNALIAAWSLRGWRQGFAVGAGAMSADLLLMVLTLALYKSASAFVGGPAMRLAMLLGSALLLFLAYRIAVSKPPREIDRGSDGDAIRGYVVGLSLGLVNPYQVGWWLTVGLSSIGAFGVAWALGLFTAIFTWIVSFPAAVRAGWRANRRATWLLIKGFSVLVLAGFGLYFLYVAAVGDASFGPA